MLVISECRTRWGLRLAGRVLPAVLATAFFTAALGFLATLPWGSTPVMAQEYIRDEEAVPGSVDQVVTPMELTFQREAQDTEVLPLAQGRAEGYSGLFSGHKA